jgi:hypothetical protein
LITPGRIDDASAKAHGDLNQQQITKQKQPPPAMNDITTIN